VCQSNLVKKIEPMHKKKKFESIADSLAERCLKPCEAAEDAGYQTSLN
jgi:hypothetical protein